jgi:hypothetical protein
LAKKWLDVAWEEYVNAYNLSNANDFKEKAELPNYTRRLKKCSRVVICQVGI